jgi:arginase
MSKAQAQIVLIGAPTDIGAGHRGASMGPEALRVAGLEKALKARGFDVIDSGNLSGPVNPWLPPVVILMKSLVGIAV